MWGFLLGGGVVVVFVVVEVVVDVVVGEGLGLAGGEVVAVVVLADVG